MIRVKRAPKRKDAAPTLSRPGQRPPRRAQPRGRSAPRSPGAPVLAPRAEPPPCYPRLPMRVTYGPPFSPFALRNHPDCEMAVVVLFALLASELGFVIEKVRAAFPDCEALRRVTDREWQRVRIEFEYESRSFQHHGHNPKGCDLIVCWRHNWPECPPKIEVLALKDFLEQRAAASDQ